MAVRSLIVKIGADYIAVDQALQTIGKKATSAADALKKVGETPLGKQAQQDAERLTKSLDALVQGQQRLASGAKNAAAGIAAIGGPARLTKQQLDEMNRTLQSGLDAFRAMGQQAPRELQKVADAVAKQRKELDAATKGGGGSIFGKAGDLLGGLGISAGALTGAGVAASLVAGAKAALDYADSLTKLSDRTGISTTSLQRLGAVADASGNNVDQIASAVNQFQKRIASGEKETTAAIQRIGLSVTQLRGLAPDDQFFAIAKAIQQIKDPADQARAAMELFGKSGAELLPTLKADVDKLKDSTFKMSAESVKALDDLGDAFGRAKTSTVSFLGEMIGQIVIANQKWLEFKANLESGGKVGEQQALQSAIDTALKNKPGLRSDISLEGPAGSLRSSPISLDEAAKALTSGLDAQLKKVGESVKFAEDRVRAVAQLMGTDATRAASVYEAALGGLEHISQLTAAAQSSLRSSVAQAIAVYEAQGRAVPQSLRNIITALDAEASARRIEANSLRQILPLYGNMQLSLDQMRNLAQGFTADGLIPMNAGFTDAARSASALDAQLKRLRTTRDTLAAAVQNQNVGLPGGGPSSLTQALRDAHTEASQFRADLDTLAQSMVRLADVSGDSFDGIVRDLANIVVAWDAATKAADAYAAATTKAGKTAALLAGAASVAQATGSGSTTSRIVGGGLAGAQIGAEIGGPLGAGIGFGIGAAIGAFRALHKAEWQKLGADIGRDLGVHISDGLAQQMEADSKKFGRQAASLLNLDKIIGEAGGVEAFGVDKAISKTRDLFVMLETGKLTARQVGAEFDKVFAQLVPAAINKTTGLASRGFVELQQLALSKGIKSDSLDAFRKGQVENNILGGLSGFLGTGQKIGSQETASALGDALAAGFSELNRQGVPLLDIFKQMDPLITQLSDGLKAANFGGGSAFDAIFQSAALAKDEIAGPALQSVQNLGQVLAGLSNTGALTQDTFAGLTQQVTSTFANLTAQGKGGDQALRLMQPTLQEIWELQQRFGYSVDAATQDLLNQAEAAGIVGEAMKSPQQQQIDAANTTNKLLLAIADALGAKIPEAARKAAQGVNNELGKIEDPEVTLKVNVEANLADLGMDLGDRYVTQGAMTGGRVLNNGLIQHFDTGGVVLPFRRRGTDTVPAMLTPGEIVLNAAQQGRVAGALAAGGDAAVAAIRELASALLGRPVVVQVEGEAIVKAQHRTLERSGSLRAQTRDLLGVA